MKFLALCLKNIWLATATYDIDLRVAHVSGSQNAIANALSRIYSLEGILSNLLGYRHKIFPGTGFHHSFSVLTFLFKLWRITSIQSHY